MLNSNKLQAACVILNFLVATLKSKRKGKNNFNNMFLTQYIQNLTNIKILRNFTFFFILVLCFEIHCVISHLQHNSVWSSRTSNDW